VAEQPDCSYAGEEAQGYCGVEVALGYYMKAFAAAEKHIQFGREPVANNWLLYAESYQPQALPLIQGAADAPLKFLTEEQ